MSGAALLLVFTAAVVHTAWNTLAKRAADPLMFLWSSVSLATIVLAPFGAFVLRGGGWSRDGVPFVLGTIILHGVYFYALARAYASGELSLVYPIARGLGVALVPVVAFAALGERLSPLGIGGVALVVAGIVALHHRPRAVTAGLAGGSRLGSGVGWAILTGFTIAAYSTLDKAGVARVDPLGYISLMGAGISLMLLPLVWRRADALRREWRANGRFIAAAAAMNLTSYLLVLYAFQLSKAAYVVAARETSIVLSVLIGSMWLKEGRLGPRLAGAAVVLAGVICVALAR